MPIFRKDLPMSRKCFRGRTTKVDINTLVTTHEHRISKNYVAAVDLVIKVYRSGISFNKAVDQVAASYKYLNRNTLAKHALGYIANDY